MAKKFSLKSLLPQSRLPMWPLLAVSCAIFIGAPASAAADSEDVFDAITSGLSPGALRPGPSDRPNHPVNRVPVSLTAAFSTSYTQNPSVVAALKNLDIAKAQVRTAGARPNPQFAMQYGFGNPYTEAIAGNTQHWG